MADIISLILSAKNDASKAINQVNKDITALEKQVGKIGNLQKVQTAIASGFAIGAFTQTISQIVEGTGELSQAGANIERLRASFESLATQNGTSGAKILSSIDSITQGTLSQQAMMEQANAAMLLGVANTGEEFETLAKIAIDRGRKMGISMEYAFESIVKGVGRLSPLILDNLGIVLDADTTYAQFAKTIGKTADSLTDMEKRQALIGRLKEETTGFDTSQVLDAAGSWEKFTASMTNAAAAAGVWINAHTPLLTLLKELTATMDVYSGYWSDEASSKVKGYQTSINELEAKIASLQATMDKEVKVTDVGSFFESIMVGLDKNGGTVKEIEHLTKWVAQLKAEINSINAMQGASANRMAAGGSDVGEIVAQGFSTAENATVQLEARVADMAKEMGITKDAAMNLAMGVVEFKGSIYGALPSLDALIAKAIQAKVELQALNSVVSGALSGFQSAVVQAYVDSGYSPEILAQGVAMGETLKANTAALEDQGYTWIVTEAKAREMQDAASAGFIAVSDGAREAEKAASKVKDTTVKLTEEFQNLRSIVEGIVSGAMQDIGGAKLEDYLPHMDTASEPARRIASVMVEGFDSEWAGYFQKEFPLLFSHYMGRSGGDVQKAAALLLNDFQNGLRPELLDKNKIKDLAIAMFRADQATTAMVDGIAKDVANELQISIEDATAAVGGAVGGSTKKKMDAAEAEKILAPFKTITPTVDFSNTGPAMKEAGQKAGVLDADGRVKLPVALFMDASSWSSFGSVSNYGLTISSVGFSDVTEARRAIATALRDIVIIVNPQIASDYDYQGFKKGFSDGMGSVTLNIKPAEPVKEEWDLWKGTVQASYLALDVKPGITFDGATLDALWSPVRQSFGSAFLNDDFKAAVGTAIVTSLTDTMNQNAANLGVLGVTTGIYIYQGFAEYNLGTIIATELSNQLGQAQKTFEASAQNAGKVWGTAFIDTVRWNVPFELLLVLTDLITPGVIQRVNDEKNRGGTP